MASMTIDNTNDYVPINDFVMFTFVYKPILLFLLYLCCHIILYKLGYGQDNLFDPSVTTDRNDKSM